MEKILTLILFLALPSFGLAHPPAGVWPDYNTKNGILKLKIRHRVSKTEKHHLSKIIIWVNNEKLIEQKLFTQEDRRGHKLSYKTFLKKGDVVVVRVYCSIFGSRKIKFKI